MQFLYYKCKIICLTKMENQLFENNCMFFLFVGQYKNSWMHWVSFKKYFKMLSFYLCIELLLKVLVQKVRFSFSQNFVAEKKTIKLKTIWLLMRENS